MEVNLHHSCRSYCFAIFESNSISVLNFKGFIFDLVYSTSIKSVWEQFDMQLVRGSRMHCMCISENGRRQLDCDLSHLLGFICFDDSKNLSSIVNFLELSNFQRSSLIDMGTKSSFLDFAVAFFYLVSK